LLVLLSMKKQRNRGKKLPNLKALKRSIITLFQGNDSPLTHKDIYRLLQVKDKIIKHQVLFILKNLLTDGTLKELGHGKYVSNESREFYEGKIEKTASGAGYVICDELETDVYVPPRS
jgi:ribonuclease R